MGSSQLVAVAFAPEFCGMKEEAERRRVVRGCLWLTRGTAIAADGYEIRLLVDFIQGRLTIDQVCRLTTDRTGRLPADAVAELVLTA